MDSNNKTYYGYKPKPKDVVKLEAYVRNNTDSGVLSNDKAKINNNVTNKVLKNKRIK
jgi:hypothetical protein